MLHSTAWHTQNEQLLIFVIIIIIIIIYSTFDGAPHAKQFT